MDLNLNIPKTKAEQAISEHFLLQKTSLGAADKMADLRARAFQDFQQHGLPHRRREVWKYTDLRAYLADMPAMAEKETSALTWDEISGELDGLSELEDPRLVFVNGYWVEALSSLEELQSGIEIMPFDWALKERPSWFPEPSEKPAQIFAQNVLIDGDPLTSLNMAFMSTGAVVRIEEGAKVDRPLHLIFVSSHEAPISVAARNIISVGKGAHLTLLESHISIAKGGGEKPSGTPCASQSHFVSEVVVAAGGSLDHIKFQNENMETVHLSTWLAEIDEQATYRAFHFTLGAELSRHQLFVRFMGEKARLNISSAVLQRGRQHSDMTLVVDHAAPDCESRELFKVILDNEARAVFQGKVAVRPNAQKSDGKQMAQALLLSETAEFNSKPELEIFADDVICGHGSTSGQIDEDLLFYLKARGLPERQARALLIAAFAGEVLDVLEHEGIREAFSQMTSDWLT